MKVSEIHEPFLRRLSEGFIGKVHSVFHKAVNIVDADGTVYTILSMDMDRGPLSMTVDVSDFLLHGVRSEEPVKTLDDRLWVGDKSMDFSGAESYELSLPKFSMTPLLTANVLKCRDFLMGEERIEVSPYYQEMDRMLAERTSGLKRAVVHEDMDAALAAGRSLLGLGQGLTPSGDDILLGFFAVIMMKDSPLAAFQELPGRILIGAEEKTNILSLFGLIRGASGLVREKISGFMHALVYKENIEKELHMILSIGHTSGRDITEGILSIIETIIEKENRNGYKDYYQKEYLL